MSTPGNARPSLKDVFVAAIALGPEERGAYLDEACGDDRALRSRAEALLRVDAEASAEGHDGTGMLDRGAPLPEELGLYRPLHRLGEGGFGAVYLAEQREPVQRLVALKVIKPGMDSRQVVARFEAERQALALMSHPNIARVLDAGTTAEGRPYFVMDLVLGPPITQYCSERALSIEARLRLVAGVCHAIQHAHQKGVIHRDLKPSNVLVEEHDGAPVPRVIDFGIAKAIASPLTARTLLTDAAQLVGTPAYMSPEQAEGGSADVDTRSDVYALGAVLYELLTGEPPIDRARLRNASFLELQRMIVQEVPPRPSERVRSRERAGAEVKSPTPVLATLLRGELDWIVMKALEKDRARRYQSASELAGDLERYLAGQPVLAAPPSATYRVRTFVRRHRVAVGATAAVVVSLVAGTATSIAFAVNASREASRATTATNEANARALELGAANESLRSVVDFQVSMLEGLDAAMLGQTVIEALREQVATSLAEDADAGREQSAGANELESLLRRARGTDLARTVIEEGFLGRAREAVERDFADRPRVRAGLLRTIGTIYLGLGDHQRAAECLEPAYEALVALAGERDRETLRCRHGLVVVDWLRGEVERAAAGARACRLVQEDQLGELDADTLTTMSVESHYTFRLGRTDVALELARDLVDRHERSGTLESDVAVSALNQLAGMLIRQNALDEADGATARAIEVASRLPRSTYRGDALGNRAWYLSIVGRLSEALPLRRAAYETAREELGSTHPSTLNAMQYLAWTLGQLQDFDEALRVGRESVALLTRTLGPEHPHTIDGEESLASIQMNMGLLFDAERTLRHVVELRRRSEGAQAMTSLLAESKLGICLWKQERFDEAFELLDAARAVSVEALGPTHVSSLELSANVALVAMSAGDLDVAEELYREVLEARTSILGAEADVTVQTRGNLASVLGAQGRYAEAAEELRAVLESQRTAFGVGHPMTAHSMRQLAYALHLMAVNDEAESLLRATLEIAEQVGGESGRRERISGLTLLGPVLGAQQRYEEAEESLLEAIELCRALVSPAPSVLADTIDRLVSVYDDSGRAEDAAYWRQQRD